MNIIKLDDVIITKNRIDFKYTIDGDIIKYFNLDNPMYLEFSEDISTVPKGIANIPFLANILPVAWLNDAHIYIDEIDKSFYDSIEDFKRGYIEMYPKVSFKGKLIAKNIIDYTGKPSNKVATFLSGGVDSTSTLIDIINRNEKPELITIWGSDIFLDDYVGWENVRNDLKDIAKNFNLKNVFIKSNFRGFLSEKNLNKDFSKILGDNWWHGLQHGIGIISHSAIHVYMNNLSKVYFPATHCTEDKNVVCASYPTIDNKVKMASSIVIHDGFEYDRQDKIQNIYTYKKNNKRKIFLRVCYSSKGGKNCSKCEKCSRTMMGIIAEGGNPVEFGFSINTETLTKIRHNLNRKWYFSNQDIIFWKCIQSKFKSNSELWCTKKEISWILDYEFDRVNNGFMKKIVQLLKNHVSPKVLSNAKKTLKSIVKN